MPKLLFRLVSIALWLAPALCHASFIRITVEAKIEEGTDAGHRALVTNIQNEGDEGAYEVALEVLGTHTTKVLSDLLGPGAKIEDRQSITLTDFGATGEGRYIVPIRILYRDANRYPFSAPSIAMLDIGSGPVRAVALLNQAHKPLTNIEIIGKKDTKLLLVSLSQEPATIDRLSFLTAAELPAAVQPSTYPIQLTPQAQLPITLNLQSVGTLAGSTYPGLFIVSGELSGKHFAEPFPISVTIGQEVSTTNIMPFVLLAAAILIAGGFAYLLKQRHLQKS